MNLFNKKPEVKQVKCETCKHYIDLGDAQMVVGPYGPYHYCPMHRKNYDRIDYREVCTNNKKHRHDRNCILKYVNKYYKKCNWIEVNEDGSEIKPKI